MRVAAPGKVLLSGAYAVLEGATAIVLAVDRYAVASAEDSVDSSALFEGEGKLGLGSSAAFTVASLGFAAASRGDDLADASVRAALFERARAKHAAMQSGGSGVDVAASVYGGALAYALVAGAATIAPVELPGDLAVTGFFSGTSAKTSDLRAKVDLLRARDPATHARCLGALHDAAASVKRALDQESAGAAIDALRAAADGLAALGTAADAPIVPPAFAELARVAAEAGGVFFPSGAGGGDVGLWVGRARADREFVAKAQLLGMRRLAIGLDRGGVRKVD